MSVAEYGAAPPLALVNGTIVTMDPGQPAAAAVAVVGGRVAFVGDSREAERIAGPAARVIDLAGRTVIPGLVDTHVHLATDAASRDQVDVRDLFGEVGSIATIAERLRSAAAGRPPGTWIAARGSPMQALRLEEGRLPTRLELDAAVPDQPAYVTFGAHILVANSAAMAARGIDRSTADPDRGVIERDAASGEPTGVFHERAGVLVKGPAGALDPAVLEDAIELELERCLSRGVTTIHDVVADPSELEAYRRLRQADRLRARVAILVRVVQFGLRRPRPGKLGSARPRRRRLPLASRREDERRWRLHRRECRIQRADRAGPWAGPHPDLTEPSSTPLSTTTTPPVSASPSTRWATSRSRWRSARTRPAPGLAGSPRGATGSSISATGCSRPGVSSGRDVSASRRSRTRRCITISGRRSQPTSVRADPRAPSTMRPSREPGCPSSPVLTGRVTGRSTSCGTSPR